MDGRPDLARRAAVEDLGSFALVRQWQALGAEARHMRFYARFQDEVVADPAAIATHVERAREQICPAFRQFFDVAFVEAHERLLANPPDGAAKVRFVTLHRQLLEGTHGLTSFSFVAGYLEREALPPRLLAGYSRVHHDEHRHIGYGTGVPLPTL